MSARDVIEGRARWTTLVGDVRETLRSVPDGCAQTCVTSPPYFGLRDYGNAAQIGQETTPREFVDALVAVMRDVRRVLADDGTLWLNIGDSHRDKNLLGIPWRLAFALQDDGWYLRSDIIWAKPNPMPESVTDRPTRAHEYVFLLTKRARYFYDADAIREPATDPQTLIGKRQNQQSTGDGFEIRKGLTNQAPRAARNARDVWTVTPEPCDEAHFATMPPDIARRCILAGSRRGDIVLDPFGGAGTTALAALQHGRRALLCELNPDYVEIQRRRLSAFDADTSSPIAARGADFGPLFGGAA